MSQKVCDGHALPEEISGAFAALHLPRQSCEAHEVRRRLECFKVQVKRLYPVRQLRQKGIRHLVIKLRDEGVIQAFTALWQVDLAFLSSAIVCSDNHWGLVVAGAILERLHSSLVRSLAKDKRREGKQAGQEANTCVREAKLRVLLEVQLVPAET